VRGGELAFFFCVSFIRIGVAIVNYKNFLIIILLLVGFSSSILAEYEWETGLISSAVTDTGNAFDPKIAIDGDNKAHIAWFQYDNEPGPSQGSERIYYWYDGSFELISSSETNTGNARNPEIAVDGDNKAHIAWNQYDGPGSFEDRRRIYYWHDGSFELISSSETNTGDAFNQKIAVDGENKAHITWQQLDSEPFPSGGRSRIYYWHDGSSQLISSSETDTGDARNPQIAVDGDNKVHITWNQYDDEPGPYQGRQRIYYWYDGSSELISSSETNTGNAFNPQIVVDGENKAHITWGQYDGPGNTENELRIYYWYNDSFELISSSETDTGDAFDPKIAVDGDNKAHIAWIQYDGVGETEGKKRVYYKFDKDPILLVSSTLDVGDTQTVEIAVDGDNQAHMTWQQYDGPGDTENELRIYYWHTGSSELISSSETDTGDAYNPQIGVDGDNKAHITWIQYDGPGEREDRVRVYYAQQMSDEIPSPTVIAQCRKQYRFPTQIDIVDTFCWAAVENAVSYNIYADAELTIVLDSKTSSENLIFCKHCVKPCCSTSYYLTAIDETGAQSEPTVVALL